MKLIVIGAGMMGYAITHDLMKNKNVEKVLVVDKDRRKLEYIKNKTGADIKKINIENKTEVKTILKNKDACVSAVPYFYNYELTQLAIKSKVNFCDLGGNVMTVQRQLSLNKVAKKNQVTVIPDCGLAPGLVNILTAKCISELDITESVHIRVGGLPQNPRPPLDYALFFSPWGLINEYTDKAIVLRDGNITELESLTELEQIKFNNFPELEAFITSGGTSTLPYTYKNKILNLDYKTIRYKGHCEKMRTLFSLGLADTNYINVDSIKVQPRAVLVKLLEQNLPRDKDVVLVRVSAQGFKNANRKEIKYEIIDYFDDETKLTAMMRMTGFPAAIILQMLGAHEIEQHGVLPQEVVVDPDRFIEELRKRKINIE